MEKALQHIKVLDFSSLLPGPLASLYLQDLGAEVIKVERPHSGDELRSIPPLLGKTSLLFHSLNSGKKSISVDLKDSEQIEKIKNLIKKTDVLVEGFRPGTMKRLNLDYDTLKKINPKLIYCSITGYGQEGELSQLAGHDINYMAESGLLDQTGAKGPSIGNLQVADTAGGSLHAVIAIQAALLQRERSGEGAYIDISMTDCVLALAPVAYSQKDPVRGKEILSGGYPFYGVYKTKDEKFMALGALEKKFWENFCRALSKDDWIEWPKFQEKYDQFKDEITRLFASKTQTEWVKILSNADCCCNAVKSLKENKAIISSSNEDGDYYQVPFPVKMNTSSLKERGASPKLGQHNDEVLS